MGNNPVSTEERNLTSSEADWYQAEENGLDVVSSGYGVSRSELSSREVKQVTDCWTLLCGGGNCFVCSLKEISCTQQYGCGSVSWSFCHGARWVFSEAGHEP